MNNLSDISPAAMLSISASELIAAYRNRHAEGLLEQDFQSLLGAPFAAVTCSGAAALYILCEALKQLSSKRTILVPSFTDPLVALAIRRAGFYIQLYDIGPYDFNGDAEQVQRACAATPDIAAILISHLAGIPCDMARFEPAAEKFGLFVIEDCAQSLGALQNGRPVGSRGDFSFFSCAAGKGLMLYEGGVLVANKTGHAAVLQAALRQLVKPDSCREARRVAGLLGYWLFYLFGSRLGTGIKALGEEFSMDFPVHAVCGFRQAAAHAAFSRIDAAIGSRQARAAFYRDGLEGLQGITFVREASRDSATYPCVAVVFNRPEQKTKALKAFAGAGLGVSQLYARALADYGYLRGMVPNSNSTRARRLAARCITLSTSPFMKKRHLEKCLEIMHRILIG